MTITERTLRQWRRDALEGIKIVKGIPVQDLNIAINLEEELNRRILRLTQELMDQNLLRRKS